MRILVIEDDRATGDYLLQGLRQEGHTADLCRNGREGLIAAQASDFDVLVVDRMLPDLGGLSLVRTLRAAKNPAIREPGEDGFGTPTLVVNGKWTDVSDDNWLSNLTKSSD